MMKLYDIYIFVQNNCDSCYRLKDYIYRLPVEQQKEIKIVPFKCSTNSLKRTALAEQLDISVTPTMCITHRDLECELWEGDEYCEMHNTLVEKIEGAVDITKALPSSLSAYTYVDNE